MFLFFTPVFLYSSKKVISLHYTRFLFLSLLGKVKVCSRSSPHTVHHFDTIKKINKSQHISRYRLSARSCYSQTCDMRVDVPISFPSSLSSKNMAAVISVICLPVCLFVCFLSSFPKWTRVAVFHLCFFLFFISVHYTRAINGRHLHQHFHSQK